MTRIKHSSSDIGLVKHFPSAEIIVFEDDGFIKKSVELLVNYDHLQM